MRFSTLIPLLLAAGVAQAQFGGQGQNGQNNNQNGQNGQNNNNNQNGQNNNNNQNGQNNNNQNGQNNNNNQNGQNNNNQNGQNNNNNNNALQLNPANVQTNSQNDGLQNAEEGQAASATDDANFINFCTGQTLTNGLQVKQGSCNGIPMGKIPAADRMVSAVMINPKNNQNFQSGQDINFQVRIANLNAGSFTNPDVTYYAAPQDLQNGQVTGHTHITCQDTGATLDPEQPLDAQTFAFFKGINDAGDGNGLLSANLAGGLPDGNYRVCSMTSASNHQPVLMPVAQRGPQDDCVRFTVGGGGNNNNNNNNNQNGQNNNNQNGQNNNQNGQNNNQNGQNNNQNGQGQQGQGQQGQQGQGQQGQQGQGQQGGQRGKGRRNRVKFASRHFQA